MKGILTLLFLTFSLAAIGQSRSEIISLMKEYAENYGKPNYSNDFIDLELNPALLTTEIMVCENNDTELFNCLLEMILATIGSANEASADILGGIFICNPELVEDRLTGEFKNGYLINILEFGFSNKTYGKTDQIENYDELERRLLKLIK